MATVIDGTSGSSIAGAGSVVGNLSVGGDLTVTGSITAGSGTVYNLEQYTSPATWTKPTGLKAVKVTVVGAGGDGGAYSSTGSTSDAGAGGGAGGATIDYIPAPSIPGPVAVTAGPGTNSFGGFCSATAGSAGSGFPGSGQGGVGGIGTGGSVNCNGAAAENVYATKGTNGAASILGGGAQAVFRTTAGVTPGVAGVSYGSGGSGAQKVTPSSATGLGGTGAPGIVIVEEFY
jgi:hypothetical protein